VSFPPQVNVLATIILIVSLLLFAIGPLAQRRRAART
jgi:ABC-type spermidine/putrescine transport system permease subunit II